jgi:hypothetical protein
MAKHRFWQGVRMRRVWARADPDDPPRQVTLPAAWEDAAADALAALLPGSVPVHLADAAEAWIGPLETGTDPDLGARLRRLLLHRQAAPGAAIWQGVDEADVPACATLNLAGFHDPQSGFDVAGFVAAIGTLVQALSLARPAAEELRVGMAGFAALLGLHGIAYDSEAARDVAACLAALLRGVADQASARMGARGAGRALPPVPACCAIPGLAEAARRAAGPHRPRHRRTVGIGLPGPVEALLGIETGGIAPAFSPITPALTLTATARGALAGQTLSAEAALARLYAGLDPLPVPSVTAHAALHDAVAPFLPEMPPRPSARPVPQAAPARELPPKRRGYTQRASVGGHRIYLSTGEYDDGALGEISVALPKESPTVRGLMDGFAQAVSLGLQHGVPLAAFVEAFAGTRFGPGGIVEGDAAVSGATSLIDYVMRSLAASYLGAQALPAAEPDPAPAEAAPLLPLDLPRERRLRLVSSRVGG